jgi:hypothetical protein
MAFLDRCIFIAVSGGTGDFVESTNVLGFKAGAVNGLTC